MSMDNRNEQDPGQQNKPQQTQTGGANQANEENPQEGDKWDNYQTRELSDEGGQKIQEGDLLSADEANKQQPEHRG
jgi:hypothetical protein